MAAQKWTVFFAFLVLFAVMEEVTLTMNFTTVNICEHDRRTISCPSEKIIHVLQASYGRQTQDICPNPPYTNETNCHAVNSHEIVVATCAYKPSCELWADNSVFDDPCPPTYKYLMVRYKCANLFVLCEGIRGTLRCPEGKLIKLLQASYGRHDKTTCPSDLMSNTNCHSADSHTIVEDKCDLEPSCELFADNSVFGDPCPETHKYLRVMYECI